MGEGSMAVTPGDYSMLLHFYFWWFQEGPIFLLPLFICLEVAQLSTWPPRLSSNFFCHSVPFGFLSFSLFLPLSLPFMHPFGFSLLPFNLQLSKEFHVCLHIACLHSSRSSSFAFLQNSNFCSNICDVSDPWGQYG